MSVSLSLTGSGNVTLRDCASEDVRFHWASDNTLRALKVVGGDSVDFYYDASGRLVKRAVNGSTDAYFLWSGNSLFAELDTNGSRRVEYSYYPGLDKPHAIVVGDTVYFAHRDGFGNVIGLTADNKVLKATYDYELAGDHVTTPTESLQGETNRARFKGALFMGDEGPELYYMRSRWYEPISGWT